MNKHPRVGHPLPRVALARASADAIEPLRLDALVARRRALVFGVPGAFTPVCTHEHVPDFVANAAALRRSGYELLVCVAPNDPFTLHAWSRQVDPEGELVFLSDGNGELARALGLAARHPDYYLGHSNDRYLMTVADGRIAHLAVEPSLTVITCTRPRDLPPHVDGPGRGSVEAEV
ncbi:redoxin domain-containing protein [Sphingomonas parva]|uniref:Redoxin domain-containing protein n=1 Tax=Sphingomonas parva TaxID=2555898 RepID=A0A4Y8ZSZ4_9SPHN|nr:redoxin family protein [Sphingomonas parva]TFI59133.1 redoxin domain-containing protein [Sphingomonas parva]